MRMFDDGSALLRLRRGRHLSITKYFVIVVPEAMSNLRRPSDFRLDEVGYLFAVVMHATVLANSLPTEFRDLSVSLSTLLRRYC